MLSIARNNTGHPTPGRRAKVPWAGARTSGHVARSTSSNISLSKVVKYQLRSGCESDAPTIRALISAERHQLPTGTLLPCRRKPFVAPGGRTLGVKTRDALRITRMNPLGLQPERFTVAVAGAPEGGERVVGIVQVAPLGEGSTGGNAPSPASVELRSLVVARRHRRRGLGARLVRHRLAQLPPRTQVWLTTVERQEAFYNKLGFERQPLIAAPGAMRFEVAAGLLVARLVAKQQLLLMRGTVPGP